MRIKFTPGASPEPSDPAESPLTGPPRAADIFSDTPKLRPPAPVTESPQTPAAEPSHISPSGGEAAPVTSVPLEIPPTARLDIPSLIKDEPKLFSVEHALLKEREALTNRLVARCRDDFASYVKWMDPNFTFGPHHQLICDRLMDLEAGRITKLMIFLPPGGSKTSLGSHHFVAWCFGRNPSWYTLSCSHTQEYAASNGRKVRNYLDTIEFQTIFPEVFVSPDSRANHRWHTNKEGVYTAAGVGSAIAGKRGHIGIIDDAVSEQTAYSDTEKRRINEWYYDGFESRLMPNGRQLIINTRWAEDDLAGFLLEQEARMKKRGELIGDEWTVISIPALLDKQAAELLGLPEGETYFPPPDEKSFGWPTKRLLTIKKQLETSGQAHKWNALYMQNPVPTEGNIFQRIWFQEWQEDTPPDCFYIIQSLDTAYTDNTENDPSVVTTWGLFYDKGGLVNMILLSAVRGWWEFPALVEECQRLRDKYNPDNFIIEKKASGISLVQTLKERGIPLLEWSIERTGAGQEKSKKMRAWACTDIISSGKIWLPQGKKFAQDLLAECLSFPHGKHDDFVDSMTQAILFVKNYGLLMHAEQEIEYMADQRRSKRHSAPRKYY